MTWPIVARLCGGTTVLRRFCSSAARAVPVVSAGTNMGKKSAPSTHDGARAHDRDNGGPDSPQPALSLTVKGWSELGAPVLTSDEFAALGARHPKRFNERLQSNLEGIYATRAGHRSSSERNKCARCWMVPRLCLCTVFPSDSTIDAGVDVVCYLHWREASMRKASNTAKLVPMLLTGGRIVACGDVGVEAELYRLLEESDNAAILFPCDDALSVRDWLASRCGTAAAAVAAGDDREACDGDSCGDGGNPDVVCDIESGDGGGGDDGASSNEARADATQSADSACGGSSKRSADDGEVGSGGGGGDGVSAVGRPSRPTLVVLDGTWAEARQLNKFLPAHATRVKLEEVPDALAQLRTRWAHPDLTNVQSFSAVIAALGECGLCRSKCDSLTKSLQVAIDGYVAQTFPEKAQKPLFTRLDRRGQPSLLADAVAASRTNSPPPRSPPPHNPRTSAAAAAASAEAAARRLASEKHEVNHDAHAGPL